MSPQKTDVYFVEGDPNTRHTFPSTDHYKGGGGQANIFCRDDKIAFKIYHDPSKAIPEAKIRELSQLTDSKVVKPLNLVRDSKNQVVGYTMNWLGGLTDPMCFMFDTGYQDKHNMDQAAVINFVKGIQTTIASIHSDGCLVVDLNEMNLLAGIDHKSTYFIDTDSYQTQSFRASAIMSSIRDRLVTDKKSWTQLSDWFSFACIAFNIYIGVHPYRGKHPDYTPKEWERRMDDFVSIFDPKVKIAARFRDFSYIPGPHLAWMRSLFVNNDRSIPPFPDAAMTISPVIHAAFKTIQGDGTVDVKLYLKFSETVMDYVDFRGIDYTLTTKGVYNGSKSTSYQLISGAKQTLLCPTEGSKPVIGEISEGTLIFADAMTGADIGRTSAAEAMMRRNNCIYSKNGNTLFEHAFGFFGSKVVHQIKPIARVAKSTSKLYPGVVVQDLLRKKFLTIPYEQGKSTTLQIPELEDYVIVHARGEGNVVCLIVEKDSVYSRIVLSFDDTFHKYTYRIEDNVTGDAPNFTVRPNGVCIMATDNGGEIFKGDKIKVLDDAPYDAGTPLFNKAGDLYFISGDEIFSISSRKK